MFSYRALYLYMFSWYCDHQTGCGCLGQEEHLKINLYQFGFESVLNRINVDQFYRIIFLITQSISKHFNCKRIMRGRNQVKKNVGTKRKGVVLCRTELGFGTL